MSLKTDYIDDVLDVSKNTKRKYNMLTNSDGTVSFEDVTEYTQVGDSFGAADMNATNSAINNLNLTANNVTYDNSTSGMAATDVQNAIDEVFQYASDGKQAIANAITGFGLTVEDDATFDDLAAIISANLTLKPNADDYIYLTQSGWTEATSKTFDSFSLSSETEGQNMFALQDGMLIVQFAGTVAFSYSAKADVYGSSDPGNSSATVKLYKITDGATTTAASKTGSYKYSSFSTITGEATIECEAGDIFYVKVTTSKKCRITTGTLRATLVELSA